MTEVREVAASRHGVIGGVGKVPARQKAVSAERQENGPLRSAWLQTRT